MIKRIKLITVITVLAVLLLSFGVLAQVSEKPDKTSEGYFSIILSVYSGKPNPQWWVKSSDPEYKQLVELISSLKTSKKPLFKYEEWNRLGYASFRIINNGVKELPGEIHIWRDMAYIVHSEKRDVSYATGALKIYDILVAQAEKRDLKNFFINYHKLEK